MPRRKRAQKRRIEKDLKHGNLLIAQFVNKIMMGGKKGLAESLVYKALSEAGKKIKKDEVEVFEKALSNVKPAVEVRPKRIGGASYQVPMEVPEKRSTTLAMRWMIKAARDKKSASFDKRLASEILAAYNNEGAAIKKKEDTHRMAEANKALAYLAKR